jgi:hypothetical protein
MWFVVVSLENLFAFKLELQAASSGLFLYPIDTTVSAVSSSVTHVFVFVTDSQPCSLICHLFFAFALLEYRYLL